MPTTRSRVDCGLALTMASFSPTIRLRSVDLPAFGLPTTVTIPARVIGCRRDGGGGGFVPEASAALQTQQPGRAGARPGCCSEVPATAYSPASSRTEYHRRCRA